MLRTLSYIVAEIVHRPARSLALALGATVAAAIVGGSDLALSAMQKENRKVQLVMGLNLRIVPAATDMSQFWLQGYGDATMPQAVVHQIAGLPRVTMNHLVAVLHRRIDLQGRPAILTGVSDEVYPEGAVRSKVAPVIDEGTVHVGAELARQLNLKPGQPLQIGEREFQIARCAPATGEQDDVRLTVRLEDAQAALGSQDEISEVQAIDCLCLTPDADPRGVIEREVHSVAPETMVVMRESIAEGRARSRILVEGFAAWAAPVATLAAAIWTALFLAFDVRERSSEIGMWQALGRGGGFIASLVVGKSLLLVVGAATLGWLLGTGLVSVYAESLFPITAQGVRPAWTGLRQVLAGAAALAVMAAAAPAALALRYDPVASLRRD